MTKREEFEIEVVEAIKVVEEQSKVLAILKSELSNKNGVAELCKDYIITARESRVLNISRGSALSVILSMYMELNK